jgi:hypothetical protein
VTSLNGVSFAGVGDSISEKKRVLAREKVVDERKCSFLEELRLGRRRRENSRKGE